MSTALRVVLSLGVAVAALMLLLGPRWRGAFYQSWLRPRLVAFGILLVVFAVGLYLYKVLNALHAH